MLNLLSRIWRSVWPKWELRWCIATSLVDPDWRWNPYQCWYRNGKLDVRYRHLIAVPVDPNTKKRAAELASEFNQISDNFGYKQP